MKLYKRVKKSPYSKKDAKLPSSYSELFFDTIKQNWRLIIGMGLVSLLFFLPTLISVFVRDYYTLSLLSSETLTENEMNALRLTANNIFYIFTAVGVVFASIGVSGISRINLLIAREEGVFFFKDFNLGVKQNLRNNFVFFLIYGGLVYFSLLVVNNINDNFIKYIPFALIQSLFFPMLLVNVNTTSIYKWDIKASLINSFIIYVKNFFIIILFAVILTSSTLLLGINEIFLKYVLIALVIILIYPFVILALRVYVNKVLDRDINKEHYPEIYMKGIDQSQKEEKEFKEKVVTAYYTTESTFKTLKNDPYLNEYYYHLCGYRPEIREAMKSKIVPENDIWPCQDVIDSLNFLRELTYDKSITYLQRRYYSVLGLRQKEKAKVAIVLAGGGYGCVCTLPEDIPVSVELYKKGLNVFSFNYPVKKDAIYANDALKEFIDFLFKYQDRMNIDMEDYVVIGFSAAGHLTATLGTDNLGIDKKPLLLGLCYPVISMKDEFGHIGSRDNLLGPNPSQEDIEKYSIELHVNQDYPATFIWQCDKDNVVNFENSLQMVEALKNNNIEYKFESFNDDVHGYGLGNGKIVEGWLERFYEYYLSLLDKKHTI